MLLSRHVRRCYCAFIIASLLTFFSGSSASAGNFYWVGDNVNNPNAWNAVTGLGASNWSSSASFNASTGIALPGSGDNVYFYFSSANLNTVLGQNFTINSLNFSSNATSLVTIGGTNTLTIGTGGLNVFQGAGSETLSTAVALGGTEAWTNNSTNAVTVSGVISGSSGNNLTIAGIAGNGGFNFTAANTYTGTTTLSTLGASLTLSGANGSLATTAITLAGGTLLTLDNTVANNSSRIGSSVPIGSSGATISLLGSSATQTVGPLTLTTGTTLVNVSAGSALTFSGAGLVHVTGGTVNFSTTGTTNIATIANANGIIGGFATIGNVGSVQQDSTGGSNVLDFAALSGTTVVPYSNYAVNTFTPNTVNTKLNTLQTFAAATSTTINSLYLTGAARITLGTGTTATTAATLIVGQGGIISNQATQLFGGSGPQIDLVNAADIGSGVVNATTTAGATPAGLLTSGVGDLEITTASNLRIDALIENNGTTVVNLTKNGSGTLDLSDGNGTAIASTYTGITTINGGLVTIKGDTNIGAAPTSHVANSITLNGGELRMTATITLNANRGILVGPQGGTISYNGGNTTNLANYQISGPGAITFSDIPSFGIATGTNTCGIRLNFPSNASTYTGATTFFTQGSTNTAAINAVIIMQQNNEFPDNSAVTVTNNDGKGVFNVFGFSDTWGSLAGNGNIENSTSTLSTLIVGQNNLSTTYSGSLGKTGVTWAVGANGANGDNSTGTTGAIALTKTGTGTLTMSGINQYTGATAVNGGKLLVVGSLAGTAVTVTNASLGGSGSIGGAVTITATGILAPAVTATGTSTLAINSTLSIAGGATFNYNFGAAGSPGTSDTVNATGAVTLGAGTDVLNINALTGFGTGTYNLITAAAPISTTGVTFSYNGSAAYSYSIAPSGNNLVLTVTPGNPILTWTGSGSSTWQVAGPANWYSTAAAQFASGNNVIFDDNGATAPNVTVTGGGVIASSIVFNQSANTYTFTGGPIAVNTASGGTGNVTITSGDVVFNNSSVSSVVTSIQAGSLTIGSSTAYSASVRVDVNGGPLTVNGTLTTPAVNVFTGNTLSGSGTISGNATLDGTGVINFSSTGKITGNLAVTNGGSWNGSGTVGGTVTASSGFTIGAGASLTATGGVTVTGGTITAANTSTTLTGSLNYTSPVDSTFQGVIAGAGATVTVNGGSNLILPNASNSYTGATTITSGTLSVASIANGGASSGLGASSNAAANLVFNGGTLIYTGTAATTDRGFTIDPGNTGLVTATINVTNSLTINGASAATTDNGLTKIGPGTLVLGGANQYSGPTTVSVGTFLANNATGSATGTGNVTVNAGATLGGSGFIVPNNSAGNTISVTGNITPGNPVGALTLGSGASNAAVTIAGSNVFTFNLTAPGTSVNPTNPANYGLSSATALHGMLAVNGTLTFSGTTALNISASGGGFTGNNSYSWLVAGTTAGLTGAPTLGTISGDFTNGLAVNYNVVTNANNVYLNYLAPSVWSGTTSNAWTVPANWLGNTVPASGLTALFNRASPNTTVSLGGAAQPLKILFFDTANAAAYTIGTSAGNGDGLVFDAGGGITVTSTVTTLQTINAALNPLGPMTIVNNGTGGLAVNGGIASEGTPALLMVSGTGTTTLAGNITSSSIAQLALSGPGILALSGNNSNYSGGITLNAGTLNINSAAALGTGPLTINGGSIGITSTTAVVDTLAPAIAFSANFATSGSQNLTLAGAITQNASTTITIGGSGALTFSADFSTASGIALNAAGTGTGSLRFTGNLNIGGNATNSGTGTLVLGQAGNTSTVGGNVQNSGAGAITLAGTQFNVNFALINSGAGTITLAGNTNITGAITIYGGAITQPDANTYQFTIAGGALQINPGVAVTAGGLKIAGTTSTSGQVLLATGSSLNVSNLFGNIEIGVNTASTAAIGATLIASGNAAVSLSGVNINIGGGQSTTGNRTNSLVVLGTGNNFLTASTSINLGNVGALAGGGQDGDFSRGDNLGQTLLILGKGNNTINTPTLTISGAKAPASVFLGNGPTGMTSNDNATALAATSTYAPSVPIRLPGQSYAQVTINNGTGVSSTMIVGDQSASAATGTNSIGVLDTTGGILNGTFSTVTLGFNGFGPTSSHGGGVGSWVLGVANNAVTVDKILMTNTPAATQGITAAVFSLNGGTVTFSAGNGGFAYGNTASFTNVNINLNGGLLDMNGNAVIDPALAPLPMDSFGFNGGTLRNASVIYATGGVVQNGGTILRDQAGTTTIGGTATPATQVYTVGGGAMIRLDATAGGAMVFSAGSLARVNAGTLDIIPVTGNLGSTATPNETVQFTNTIPTSTNGILDAWTVARTNGSSTASADFVTYDPVYGVVRFTGYATGNLNAASSSAVASVGATVLTLNSSPTVYALKLTGALTDSGNSTLTIAGANVSGLILDGGSIAVTALAFSTEAVIYTTLNNGGGSTISSPITAASGLTTFGPGKLTLGGTSSVGAVNVNSGTLSVSGTLNASGAVNIRNGAALSGIGTIATTGSNGVAFGPNATFAPGNGAAFGIFSITTVAGNVTTTTATTISAPAVTSAAGATPVVTVPNLTSAGLTFGLGISPTNVVGSVMQFNLGAPGQTGANDTGLSNNNTLGSLASGFSIASASGVFTLDPITTVKVYGSMTNFTTNPGNYSYRVGTVPSYPSGPTSSGSVSNLGSFDFVNGSTDFSSFITAASLDVNGSAVYLNFTTTPEPALIGLLPLAAFGFVRGFRRFRNPA